MLKSSTGRPISAGTSVMAKKAQKALSNKRKSTKDVAKEVSISKTKVMDIKKQIGLKTYKCQKTPQICQRPGKEKENKLSKNLSNF